MSWQRLEGTNVDPDITEGITAPVADPLWMLARQWQAGEFRGEDAASPILIDADVIAAPLTEFWIETPAGRSTITRQEAPWPLETLVEREPITDGPAAVRIRLERGSALLRALAGAGAPNAVLDDFRTTYPYTGNLGSGIDPVGEAQLALLARRSPDAVLVTEALVAAGSDPLQIPPLTGLGDQLAGRLAAVVRAWNEANRELFCEPSANQPTAWDESRLEYRFGVTTQRRERQSQFVVLVRIIRFKGNGLFVCVRRVGISLQPPQDQPQRPICGRIIRPRLNCLAYGLFR